MENYISKYWDYIESKDTRLSSKIYNYLNKDNLASIIVDDKVYWLETTSSYSNIPNYVYEDIKKFMSKKGIMYLYDIKTNF